VETNTSLPAMTGLVPAHITPMTAGGDVDWDALAKHVNWLMDVPGVNWLTTTAHASEVASLTPSERLQMIERVAAITDGKVGLVAGVYDDGSDRAAAQARRNVDAGAQALLIFPSGAFAGGAQMRPESQRSHYEAVAEAVDVPLIVFKYMVGSPLTLPLDTTVEICRTIPNVVAIKEWSYDIIEYEDTYRTIKAEVPHVSVLTSFSRSLFASLIVGSDGILSGHGSLVADLQSQLLEAVRAGDIEAARVVWDRIYPVAVACYAAPMYDQHNRMKAALGLLGRIPQDSTHVRRPLVQIDEDELTSLKAACAVAGIA
jgi:4-hydroxy-tetrahydrodipicolinate synthase